MNEHAKQNAGYTAFAGLLMTLYGWFQSAEGISDSAFYNATVDIFYWMLKFGGLALMIAAAVCYAGSRWGLILDAALSMACGAIMLFCGIYWIIDDGIVINYLLFAIFGVIFVRAGLTNWTHWRTSLIAQGMKQTTATGWFSGAVLEPPKAQPPPGPKPIHPASLKSEALPKDDEPPPPEGYLAALAKEKEEPPTAASD